MIQAVLDDGTVLEFPDDTDDELINQAVKDYLESLDTTTVLGTGGEMLKGLGRGFGKGLLSAGAGLAELADAGTDLIGLETLIDSGDENFLINAANQGKAALDEYMGVGEAYRDSYLVNLSEGLGSVGSFLVPGLGAAGAAARLGAAANVARNIGTATTVAAGVGSGSDDQAQRIRVAREKGIDVSDKAADLSVIFGGVVGASEAAAPLSLLKKIRGIKEPEDIVKGLQKKLDDAVKSGDEIAIARTRNELFSEARKLNRIQTGYDRVKSALQQGLTEGIQEAASGLAQDLIQYGMYDESVDIGDSAWDDFTIGGPSGAILDGFVTGIANRKRKGIRKVEEEKEKLLREEEQRFIEEAFEDAEIAKLREEQRERIEAGQLEEAEQAMLQQELDAPFDPEQPYVPKTRKQLTISEQAEEYANQLAKDALRKDDVFPNSGKFSFREIKLGAEGSVFEVFSTQDGKVYGQPTRDYESAAHLASNLNKELINRNINKAVLESMDLSPEVYTPEQAESIYVIGQKLNRPKTYKITSAVLNQAAGTVSSPTSPFEEDRTLDQLHMDQYGVPPFSDRGTKLYKPLSNLTASQEVNLDRKRKGLPEVNEFTLEEAKQILGDKYSNVFDVLLGVKQPDDAEVLSDFGTVGKKVAQSRQEYQDERSSRAALEQVLADKNIVSGLDSPEFMYIAQRIVGEDNINNMSPSQRMYLVEEIKKFPVIAEKTRLPNFTPKTYTKALYDGVLEEVIQQGDGSIENIELIITEVKRDELFPLTEGRLNTVIEEVHRDLISSGLVNQDGSVNAEPNFLAIEEKPSEIEDTPYQEPQLLFDSKTGLPVAQEAKLFEANLREQLDALGLQDIRIRVMDALRYGPVTREGEIILTGDPIETQTVEGVEGYYNPLARTIFLAMDQANLSARDASPEAKKAALDNILDHELVHAVRGLDLWKENEWSLLENAARKKMRKDSPNKSYFIEAKERYSDLTPVGQMEEAVAELIKDARKDKRFISGKPRTLIDRFYNFFDRASSAIRGTGFQSFSDIMQRLESGQVGARERGKVRTLARTEKIIGAVPERGIGLERDERSFDEFVPTPVVADTDTTDVPDELVQLIDDFDLPDPRTGPQAARRYVGAKKGLETPQALGALRRSVKALAEEGIGGRFWYERSGRTLLDLVGGDKAEADKLAQAIAITSPQTPVPTNFNYALQAYYQHKAGQPIKTGMYPSWMSKALTDVFDGKSWEGRKTNNFYRNIMREIDPSVVQGVTTDLWMMRAFGFDTDSPTDAQYTFVENETKRIADQMGWEPQQVQAAVWVAMKAKTEAKQVKDATKKEAARKKITKKENPREYQKILLKNAMKYTPTMQEKEDAKFDFSDATNDSLAQISWESIPGRTSAHMKEVFNAPFEQLQEYHVAISKAFLDEDGRDYVARELGILSTGDFEAPGFFEGRVSPGTQTKTAVPPKYKADPTELVMEQASEDFIKAYSAIRGILMKQDGVGYHRPFTKKSIRKGDLNSASIDIGRPFTIEETAELAKLMQDQAGHGEYSPIAAENGVRLINFDYLETSNKDFNNMVVKALTEMEFEGLNEPVKYGRFASQAGYIGNNWRKNKNGEDYTKSIASLSPDLQRRVEDIISKLAPRIEAVDQEFSNRYGWKLNNRINEKYRQEDQRVIPDRNQRDPEILASKRAEIEDKVEEFKDRDGDFLTSLANRNPEILRSIRQQEMLGQQPFPWQSGSYFLRGADYTKGDIFLYQLQDKFIGLKNVIEGLNRYRAEKGLDPIKDENNPYIGEETVAGRIGFLAREFDENRKKPLADKIAKADIPLEEVDEFLVLRHAIERNNLLSLRNPLLDVETSPGAGSLKTGERLTNSFVKNRMANRYGLLWNDATGTWSGGNARADKLNSIARSLDTINKETMERSVEFGLIDRESADSIMNQYKYYAPLRGKDIEDDIGHDIVVGASYSTKGPEVLTALGRESAAESPLGHTLVNAERAISRGIKNKNVGERLVKLIKDNPNPDYWQVFGPGDTNLVTQLERKYTYIGSDPELQGTKVSKIPEGANKKDYIKQVVTRPDNLGPALDKNMIGAKINGEQFYIKLNDDRLRRALQSMDASDAEGLLRKFGIVNRWLSMVNTSLNPEFVIGNFSRDVQTAIFNILGEQDMSKGKATDQALVNRVLKDVIPSMGAFYKGLRRYDIKTQSFRDLVETDPMKAAGEFFGKMSVKDMEDFKEFMGAGAKADWFHTRPPEDQFKTIQSMIDMANGTFTGNFKRRRDAIFQFVEDSNSAVENAVRFATFKASRDKLLEAGIPRDQAVSRASSLAKNLTINFNRKGMSGDLINAAYLFFNASVQGTANFARGLFGPKGNPFSKEASRVKQGAVTGLIALGAINAMRAEEESEEDPRTGRSYYSQIEPFIKERNIVIMKDNGKDYYMIPLPYGYNVFHVLGQNLYEMSRGDISAEEASGNFLGSFLSSFSPVGASMNSFVEAGLPTIFQPFLQLEANRNFFGAPIYRESFPGEPPYPDSSLAKASTGAIFKSTARFLNELTGGNENQPGKVDISPETLQHLTQFIVGGAGTFGLRSINVIEKWANSEDLEFREIPFVRRIMGEPNERATMEDFYERRTKITQIDRQLESLRGAERREYRDNNREILRMRNSLDNTERKIKKIRAEIREAREESSDSPQKAKEYALKEEALYDEINEEYGKFNKKYDRLVGKLN